MKLQRSEILKQRLETTLELFPLIKDAPNNVDRMSANIHMLAKNSLDYIQMLEKLVNMNEFVFKISVETIEELIEQNDDLKQRLAKYEDEEEQK